MGSEYAFKANKQLKERKENARVESGMCVRAVGGMKGVYVAVGGEKDGRKEVKEKGKTDGCVGFIEDASTGLISGVSVVMAVPGSTRLRLALVPRRRSIPFCSSIDLRFKWVLNDIQGSCIALAKKRNISRRASMVGFTSERKTVRRGSQSEADDVTYTAKRSCSRHTVVPP